MDTRVEELASIILERAELFRHNVRERASSFSPSEIEEYRAYGEIEHYALSILEVLHTYRVKNPDKY